MPTRVDDLAWDREQAFARGLAHGLLDQFSNLRVRQGGCDGHDMMLSLGRRSVSTCGLMLELCADSYEYGFDIGQQLRGERGLRYSSTVHHQE